MEAKPAILEIKKKLKEYFPEFTGSLESLCNPQFIQSRLMIIKSFLEKYLNYDIDSILMTKENYVVNNYINASNYQDINHLSTYGLMAHNTLMNLGCPDFFITDIIVPDFKKWVKILGAICNFLDYLKDNKQYFFKITEQLSNMQTNIQQKMDYVDGIKSNIDDYKGKINCALGENDNEKCYEFEKSNNFIKSDIDTLNNRMEFIKKDLTNKEENEHLNKKVNEEYLISKLKSGDDHTLLCQSVFSTFPKLQILMDEYDEILMAKRSIKVQLDEERIEIEKVVSQNQKYALEIDQLTEKDAKLKDKISNLECNHNENTRVENLNIANAKSKKSQTIDLLLKASGTFDDLRAEEQSLKKILDEKIARNNAMLKEAKENYKKFVDMVSRYFASREDK
ncbi:unnamed protein product [Gordionus sp. m RMFG-2023]